MPDRVNIRILGREVTLGNLQKVLYPSTGFTKGQVMDYYRRAAPWLLPHVRTRPLTLKRYPDGVEGISFYEKRCPQYRPSWMFTASVRHSGGTQLRYCSLTDLPSLIWVINLASIELHVLLSRGLAPKVPTAVIFDLDPGPPAGLVHTARTALLLREMLHGLRMQSFVKVSGKKGMHLYVPLNTPATFEETKQFARTIALEMESRYSGKVTATMARNVRGGKVFIDWSQNDEHKTTVCAYSMRPTDSPQISAPVTWDEVAATAKSGNESKLVFSPEEVISRLEAHGDLFEPVLTLRQRLPGTTLQAGKSVATWQSSGRGRGREHARRPSASRARALSAYMAKRDFSMTAEPTGHQSQARREKAEGFFVIQKHAARRLHYDFRLAMGGVLKSWAIPKGPSLDPRTKRLAVRVEDHPLDYATFEGQIPQGQYGAGEVIVWDRGVFSPLDNATTHEAMQAGLDQGKLEFRLNGVKLQGAFTLVRTGKAEEGKENWLLIKKKDEAASAQADPTQTEQYSVLSGMWIEDMQQTPRQTKSRKPGRLRGSDSRVKRVA